MAFDFLVGMLRITNLLIAAFVLLFSYMFLSKTTKRRDRKPWDYLFISSFIFLLYQSFATITYFYSSNSWPLDSATIRVLVEFLFSGLILLAFISQNDLIIRSPMILISRKVDDEKKKD